MSSVCDVPAAWVVRRNGAPVAIRTRIPGGGYRPAGGGLDGRVTRQPATGPWRVVRLVDHAGFGDNDTWMATVAGFARRGLDAHFDAQRQRQAPGPVTGGQARHRWLAERLDDVGDDLFQAQGRAAALGFAVDPFGENDPRC